MKKLLLIVLCLLICAGSSYGRYSPGSIMLFSDSLGTNCDLYDTSEQIQKIYVFHMYCSNPGATGSEWRVIQSGGATLTHLQDHYIIEPIMYIYINNSQIGISVAYLHCAPCPNPILSISYWGFGTSAECSYLHVVENPIVSHTGLNVTDCTEPSPVVHHALGGSLVINPTAACLCDVPVEETSWGRIKALYFE